MVESKEEKKLVSTDSTKSTLKEPKKVKKSTQKA